MKNNIKKLLILVIGIFVLPFIVYADMGIPDSYNYDVIITNPKGAILYTEEGKKTNVIINFDTKISINHDRLIKDELYLEYYSEEHETFGYIKYSDVKLFEEEIDFSQAEENKDKEQYYAYDETKIYKGPSAVYGEVKDVTIPAGTIINFTHEVESMWIYTEYNGTKGWVYIFDYNDIYPQAPKKTVALVSKDERVVILGDQKVYNDKGDEIGTVKSLTEYDAIYYSGSRKDIGAVYIKGEDIEGWVKEAGRFGTNGAHFIYEEEYKSIITERKGLTLFKDVELKEATDITIPCGTELTTKYYIIMYTEGDISSQIEYKGKKYWINLNYENIAEEDILTIESLGKNKTLYKYSDTEESLNIEIPAKEKLVSYYNFMEYTGEQSANDTPIYNTWYYVEYQGTKGWIYISDLENEKDPTIITPEIEDEEEPEVEEETEEDEESQNLSPKQIAIISICVAVVLAVGALTTILLINKKKKVAPTPVAEEEPTPVSEEEKLVEETTTEEISNEEETELKDKKTKKDKNKK